MAWRIERSLIRGTIDSRTRGRVTGQLWFRGRPDPVLLRLDGNPWKDLAGCLLSIENPDPDDRDAVDLAAMQQGVVGDITASRKVRVPDCSEDEWMRRYVERKPCPWHWGNSLYLEWYSRRNGRVVIESAHYDLHIEAPPAWTMSDDEEREQIQANQRAIRDFMDRVVEAAGASSLVEEAEDAPTSAGEAEADEEAARMDLLLDRVSARLDGESPEGPGDFDRIYREEREKLRRERGEPDPEPLTPEQEAERDRWIEEVNEAAREALEEAEMDLEERIPHPLVEACTDLWIHLYHAVEEANWVPEGASMEHPLREVLFGIQAAGAKLAGALGGTRGSGRWPPHPLYAGDSLVRLKKARRFLRDALAGLDAADELKLAELEWRERARRETQWILAEVNRLIADVRGVLESDA
jgi:hypothetical protein